MQINIYFRVDEAPTVARLDRLAALDSRTRAGMCRALILQGIERLEAKAKQKPTRKETTR
jgi:predicted DNA-binding protein